MKKSKRRSCSHCSSKVRRELVPRGIRAAGVSPRYSAVCGIVTPDLRIIEFLERSHMDK